MIKKIDRLRLSRELSKKHKPITHALQNIFTNRIGSRKILKKARKLDEATLKNDLAKASNPKKRKHPNLDFLAVPRDIHPNIREGIHKDNPENFLSYGIIRHARQLATLSLINKESNKSYKKELTRVHNIYNYIGIRSCFQNGCYTRIWVLGPPNKKLNPAVHPVLFNTLAYYYFKKSSFQLEREIKEIVHLMPKSIHWKAVKDSRSNVSPLYLACIKKNISTSIIELLLQKGANPNDFVQHVYGNHARVPLLKDLHSRIAELGEDRYNDIKALFIKYGYQEKKI